ncbi:MAG TPA: PIN domain-containing protein [Caulobacteraceae bacterium]
MTLSLDTNALIELINRENLAVRAAFEDAVERGEEMVVSVLASYEVRFGARFSGRRGEVAAAEELLAEFPIVTFTEADADGAANVRLALERIGQRIGAMDMLIAGQAVNRGWAVVTANVHEFGRVERLQVIDWTAGPQSL